MVKSLTIVAPRTGPTSSQGLFSLLTSFELLVTRYPQRRAFPAYGTALEAAR
jgi:hypothetical protein